MSISRRILFGAVANWMGRAMTIVMGLVLMPVLFRNLPREELGVWLLLGQSWAVLGILDLGFGVTLTRRIAFAKGKSGAAPDAPLGAESVTEIANLVATAGRVYAVLAVTAFATAFAAGVIYLRGVELHDVDGASVWLAWGVLCLAQAVSLRATPWTCLLQGVGYVGWDSILAAMVNCLTLLGQIVAVSLGGGLVALAVIAATGALVQRFLVFRLARGKRPELVRAQGRWNPAIVRSMISPALRAWLTATGIVMVHNTDALLIGRLEGVDEVPAYRAAYLVALNLHMLSAAFASASAVFISHLWQAGKLDEVKRMVQRNLRLGLCTMACGAACILVAGPSLFDVWLGPGNYVGAALMTVFLVTFVLEQQCFILSTCSRATEDEAFAVSAMLAGLLKLALSYFLAIRYGLMGLALGTLVAQLATNHWFMVYRALRRLGIPWRDHVMRVMLPVTVVFALAYGASGVLAALSGDGGDWWQLGGALVGSGGVLLVAVWTLVLESADRAQIRDALMRLVFLRHRVSAPSRHTD